MPGITLVEEGVYKGTIQFHLLNESQGGTPYVEFRVKITHRENEEGGWDEIDVPFTRPVTRYLSSNALPITVQDLAYLGYKEKSLAKLDPEHPNAHNFRGIEVFCKCDHEEYKERMREKWNLQRRKKAATPEQLKRIIGSVDEDFAAEMDAVLNPDKATETAGAF